MRKSKAFAFRIAKRYIVGIAVAKDLVTLRIHYFTISLWLDIKRWQWFAIEHAFIVDFVHIGILSFGKFNPIMDIL